jgi:hypothetical protein
MQLVIVTGLLALVTRFTLRLRSRKVACSAYAGTVQTFLLLLISCLFVGITATDGFSQSKKEREKLGMVKVRSDKFKRNKSKETAKFTSRGYSNNPPGGSVKERQKMSSFTGNGLVRVSKPGGGNIGNPGKAEAYRNLKPLKPGRNPMGEQIARKSQAYKGNGLVKSDYKKRKDARKKSKQISRYRGDLLVKKMPKGAHPSSVWRGGKVKNSYQQKEKYRQRMMKRIGRNKNNLQPNYLRKKNREEKPTYDSRESEIWSKPR